MSDNLFSYTHRSYEDSRQEGISKIPIISRGTWSDTNASDPGIIILDYVHALVDMIQFYQDHNALESFLSTAKERKNIFRLARQLGFPIRAAVGAKVDVVFSTDTEYYSPYVIPKNTVVTTSSNPKIPFVTLEDAYILPGQISATIPCQQGSCKSYTYKGTGKSSLDGGYVSEDQKVILTTLGVDLDSIEVVQDETFYWNKVDNVTFSNPNSKDFCTYLNPDGTVTVQFGNDERGYTPKETDVLIIKYKYSLGSKGRVKENSIKILSLTETIKCEDGTAVRGIKVNNPKGSVGGTDPEDSETIRREAPAVIKTQNRAVTLSDYEALAKRISGVKDAKAYDINNAPEQCLHYEVKVLVIPEGGYATETLLKEVYDYLYKRCTPPTVISVISPVYKSINISTTVSTSGEYTNNYITYMIKDKLTSYFDSLAGEIGYTINPTILTSIISTVPGVLYVESITPNTSIKLESLTVPVLGDVEVLVNRR